MVRNLVVEIELAEPAVSKVQRHFLAQPAFMTNAIAVTDQRIRIISSGSTEGRPLLAAMPWLVQVARSPPPEASSCRMATALFCSSAVPRWAPKCRRRWAA